MSTQTEVASTNSRLTTDYRPPDEAIGLLDADAHLDDLASRGVEFHEYLFLFQEEI